MKPFFVNRLPAQPPQTQAHFVSCLRAIVGAPHEVTMNGNAQECLKRAAECARLADAAGDNELKIYLMKLAASWQAAAGETIERRNLEDA
jgi:hypothetical protein